MAAIADGCDRETGWTPKGVLAGFIPPQGGPRRQTGRAERCL